MGDGDVQHLPFYSAQGDTRIQIGEDFQFELEQPSALLLFAHALVKSAIVSAQPTKSQIILSIFHLADFFHLHRILFEIKVGLCLCAALISIELL